MITSKCPLETALEQYKSWAEKTIKPLPLLNEADSKRLEKDFQTQKNRLTTSQEHQLMAMVNELMEPINKAFKRQFTASITPLACGDAIGQMEDKTVLLFERNVRGKKLLAMPGGIADPGEDLATTARREFHEETGYGCHLESQKLALVRDFTLGGPLPKITVAYKGNGKGEPVDNHEASGFKFFTPEQIMELKEDQGFAFHIPMLQKAMELEKAPMPDGSIYYCGLDRPFDQEAKKAIRNKVKEKAMIKENDAVNSAIVKVEKVLKEYKRQFAEWQREVLSQIEGFENSRDILWGKAGLEGKKAYETEYNWNDFSRLWDFLAPWQGRLLSTNPNADDLLSSINKLFNTKIKIREAGSVEIASLLRTGEDQCIVLQNDQGKFELFTVAQRYDEDFQQALYRGVFETLGLEVENGSKLWGFGYQPGDKDQLGNERRSFLMESMIKGSIETLDKKVFVLSGEEIQKSLEEGKWEKRHASLLNGILKQCG